MILELSAGLAGAVGAYFAGRAIYDDWYVRIMNAKTDRVRLDAMKQRAALQNLRHLPADENGRGGWIVSADGRITNLDTRAVFDRWAVQRIDPMAERLDRVERALIAARGVSAPEPLLEVAPENVPQLPEHISAGRLLHGAPPTYRRLILGQTIRADGRTETVTADLADLVHIAVGGSSGWGKSWFLRWMAWQLAHSTEDVRLALIDLEGATLAPFARSDRVMWPLADTEQDAAAVMGALASELNRRRELYAKHVDQAVDSLYAYNAVASEPLPPLVLVADEVTALMQDKAVEENLRTLALRGRKYGLWLMLAGQDWKAATLDTAIRNQLATCVQFKARDGTQSRVLLGHPDAAEIDVKGRAYVWRPGYDLAEIQAPALELGPARGNGPIHPMPEGPTDPYKPRLVDDPDNVRRVLYLHSQDESDTAIARKVFGHGTTFYIARVREILEQHNDNENDAPF